MYHEPGWWCTFISCGVGLKVELADYAASIADWALSATASGCMFKIYFVWENLSHTRFLHLKSKVQVAMACYSWTCDPFTC